MEWYQIKLISLSIFMLRWVSIHPSTKTSYKIQQRMEKPNGLGNDCIVPRGRNITICGSYLTLSWQGGGIECPPPDKISFCASLMDFQGAPWWWQFMFLCIFEGSYPSWTKNYQEHCFGAPFVNQGSFWNHKNELFSYFWRYTRYVMSLKMGLLHMQIWFSMLPGV